MCVDQARNASVSGKIDDLSAARYRRISAAANSGDNFVVSRSGEAYDARVRGPNRKFRFTTLENETAALDDFIHMFRGWGYTGSALKLECLKAGALLRGGRLDEAQAMINNLDHSWPAQFADGALQNAYCRLQHLRTGRKDLSLVLGTSAHCTRNSFIANKLRNVSACLTYLRPIRPKQS
jgi:hypothetical protein